MCFRISGPERAAVWLAPRWPRWWPRFARSWLSLTWVERNFGYAVAKAYAGHTDTGSDGGATATYVRATTHEVATALAALTGEPHPLATQEGRRAQSRRPRERGCPQRHRCPV